MNEEQYGAAMAKLAKVENTKVPGYTGRWLDTERAARCGRVKGAPYPRRAVHPQQERMEQRRKAVALLMQDGDTPEQMARKLNVSADLIRKDIRALRADSG